MSSRQPCHCGDALWQIKRPNLLPPTASLRLPIIQCCETVKALFRLIWQLCSSRVFLACLFVKRTCCTLDEVRTLRKLYTLCLWVAEDVQRQALVICEVLGFNSFVRCSWCNLKLWAWRNVTVRQCYQYVASGCLSGVPNRSSRSAWIKHFVLNVSYRRQCIQAVTPTKTMNSV